MRLLLLICTLFHATYILVIFDIYFRSPIDVELLNTNANSTLTPLAKRLVFIVADGLRADTCFEFMSRDERYAPTAYNVHREAARLKWPDVKESFLREVVEEKGSWGISHTRVPTESRPGHVAMIAGLYEDVSAVTKGWQENPVEFDHVFSASRRTWLWGSPDITRMFAHHHAHVQDFFYSPSEEDFASSDLALLDTWVFNKVSTMLTNASLSQELEGDKNIFFLHLLGLDSNGHAHHPSSQEYTLNMQLVDQGVHAMYLLFQARFPDQETVFVFSADHGMSSRGSHGDGDPANTRTPLIAWGAGITHESKRETLVHPSNINTGFTQEEEERTTQEWGFFNRKDVEQADLAPLMSSLLGLRVPAHSVGLLPTQYLAPSKGRTQALLVNIEQLYTQAKVGGFLGLDAFVLLVLMFWGCWF